jgi:hypothetical protein
MCRVCPATLLPRCHLCPAEVCAAYATYHLWRGICRVMAGMWCHSAAAYATYQLFAPYLIYASRYASRRIPCYEVCGAYGERMVRVSWHARPSTFLRYASHAPPTRHAWRMEARAVWRVWRQELCGAYRAMPAAVCVCVCVCVWAYGRYGRVGVGAQFAA